MNLLSCCLFALFVLVNGLSIRRDMSVARKLSTAVDLMSVDRDVGRNLPTVAWESPTVGRKSSPTALHLVSIDTGSNSNNAFSSINMTGGPGGHVTREDYLVHNAEERLRREQGTALTNILTSIATLSNSISTVGKQITALDTKIDKETTALGKQITALDSKIDKEITALDTKISNQITALDTKVTALDTKIDKEITALDTKISNQITALDTKVDKQITALVYVLVAVLLGVSTQVPFLQGLMSAILKIAK